MNTQEKFVITISREVGSGGRTVGRKLAEKLGVRFCDKELIHSLVKQFDLSDVAIERIKSEKKNWLKDLFSKFNAGPIDTDVSFRVDPHFRDYVDADEIYRAEREIVRSLAEQESCVIAGRSAFFILKDEPNKLNVFIHSSKDRRIARIVAKQGLTEAEAAEMVERIDKGRDNFVKRYSGASRYDLRGYDLVLNMDHLTEDDAVKLILDYIGGDK